MLDLEPLLQTIIEVAADLTFCQEASILLYDESHGNLEFVAAPWFKREKMQGIRVPLDKSVSGQVYTFGEPIMVQDAENDPRIFRDVDTLSEFETHSLLAVPMIFKGQVTGVLSAVNKLGSANFTEEDIRILEILASQAAIAIVNVGYLDESKRAYQELAELDRMKTDFIAITSHELRTPLGLILGHSTYMQELISEDLKQQMDVVVRSALRLKSIVDDLSKVNSFQTGESRVRRAKVDLNETIQSITRSLKSLFEEKNHTLTLELPSHPLMAECDGEKIEIALNHLLRNAITFTDENGEIAVHAKQLHGYVRIEIIDNGIGIPKKDLTRIFDRFYQVESHMTRKHGGMGLGLSVAKMMIEMHKGRVGVKSEVGVGSTLVILLPITSTESGPLPPLFS